MQEAKNAILQMRFPQKLWYMLGMHTDAILWGGTGRTILLNYKILQNYLQCDHSIFKTTNISSFIRQLNLYGFRKVTSHLQDPLCNSSNPYMHEYIHDYFQTGRPELLNKITRKAWTTRKSFKSQISLNRLVYLSPLQKARRALHIALKKAAQDLIILESSNINCKSGFDDDAPDDCSADEENVELKWLITKNANANNETSKEIKYPDTVDNVKAENTENDKYGNLFQYNTMDYSDVASQQNNYPAQFLSMPDLDSETNEDTSGVELLAEFNISNNIEQGFARQTSEMQIECNSLNCVLPSVSIDDISISERNNEDINHYNSEWDQMFNDVISIKSSNQDGVSNLRELYSQISQTIDLLNS